MRNLRFKQLQNGTQNLKLLQHLNGTRNLKLLQRLNGIQNLKLKQLQSGTRNLRLLQHLNGTQNLRLLQHLNGMQNQLEIRKIKKVEAGTKLLLIKSQIIQEMHGLTSNQLPFQEVDGMLILHRQRTQIKKKAEMLGMFRRLEIMPMIGMPGTLAVHGVLQLQMITLVVSKTILEEAVEEVEHVSSVMKKAIYLEIALKVVMEVVCQEGQEFVSSVEMHHTWLESVLHQMKSIRKLIQDLVVVVEDQESVGNVEKRIIWHENARHLISSIRKIIQDHVLSVNRWATNLGNVQLKEDSQTKIKALVVEMQAVAQEDQKSVSNVVKKIIWPENALHLIVNI